MTRPDSRRTLPSVDRVLSNQALVGARGEWSHRAVVAVVRQEIDWARRSARRGQKVPTAEELAVAAAVRLRALGEARPRRVINATGVVIHTNLGRAPLAREALRQIEAVAAGYSDLEFDLDRGGRGSRQAHVDDVLGLLFPGREALAVNNNAAALLLVLNTLALGRDVIVSRGELVEIGGSFRIPEILERSGARLVEVGTTNRTHLRDYQRALGAATALILKVWPSNYRVIGFTRAAPVAELAALGRERGVPVAVDQGCGRLFRKGPGPVSEQSVEELLDAGASVVCFSGDKLLAGPQCGILVGEPELVRRAAANPLARALRPGKLTLAALSATCRAWLRQDPAAELPALRMLSVAESDLRAAARRLAARIRRQAPALRLAVAPGASRVGGGAAPEEDIPTWVVTVAAEGVSEEVLLTRLRRGDPPVVARAQDGAVILDPRTLLPGEEKEVVLALVRALGSRTQEK